MCQRVCDSFCKLLLGEPRVPWLVHLGRKGKVRIVRKRLLEGEPNKNRNLLLVSDERDAMGEHNFTTHRGLWVLREVGAPAVLTRAEGLRVARDPRG